MKFSFRPNIVIPALKKIAAQGLITLHAEVAGTPGTMEESKEKELILAAKAGDLHAFEELVKCHQSGIRAFFRMRVFDWAAADDLAQDALITAFKRMGTFRGEARFGTWLRAIAANHLRNWLRQRRDEPVGGGEELQALFSEQIDLRHHAEHPTGRDSEEAVMLAALEGCLGKLGGPARRLLDERYTAGKSARDISASSSRGYSGVVMQLIRIRKTLADCIRRQLGVAT